MMLVEKPIRSYFITNIIVFFLVLTIYALTVFTVQQIPISAETLNEQGFPAAGEVLGGWWLGALLSVGGLASALGLFSAVLLSVSRVPKVMADDKLLPRALDKLHLKFGTPYLSIIICAVVVSLMTLWSLQDLLIIDVMVYGAGLFIEYITLIALRKKEPLAYRPFKIPVSVVGLSVMLIVPFIIYGIAVSGALSNEENATTLKPVLFALAALCSAEVAWQVIRYRHKNKSSAQ